MLYLIGTGIYYLTDMAFRAIEIMKNCDEIYIERYTNINDISSKDLLEGLVKKEIKFLPRERVESEFLVDIAKEKTVCLLIPGDPLAATTDITLITDCIDAGVSYEIVHGSSIFSAVSESGLSIYKFGATTSMPLYTENFKPESFFDVIEKNLSSKFHTLILLEAKSETDFLGQTDAANIIKNIEMKRGKKVINWDDVIVLSRIGGKDQKIMLLKDARGQLKPPISLIVPSETNQNEKGALSKVLKNSH